MFGHLFIYQLKDLLKQKWCIGWNFLFPIILVSAFSLGFGNFIKNNENPDDFEVMKVAYVSDAQNDTSFYLMIEEIAEGDEKLISIQKMSKEEAEKALKNKEIEGFFQEEILENDSKITLSVTKNGMSSTLLNEILKSYNNGKEVFDKIMKDHPENIEAAAKKYAVSMKNDYVTRKTFKNNLSPFTNYYYALLAMAALFGSWMCTSMIQGFCANLSERGKRFECSPANKMTALFAGMLACTVLQGLAGAVLILYIEFVLKISLGMPVGYAILIAFLASAVGISCGALIASFFKSEALLVGIPIIFSMLCSFLSGLMIENMKEIVEKNVPILNKINPAAVYTDCLYRLGNYGADSRFYQDIFIMVAMVIISVIVSSLLLRRRNYGSL